MLLHDIVYLSTLVRSLARAKPGATKTGRLIRPTDSEGVASFGRHILTGAGLDPVGYEIDGKGASCVIAGQRGQRGKVRHFHCTVRGDRVTIQKS